MRYYLSITFVMLSIGLQAQKQGWDTLSIQGDFIVRCACVKKKVVVIDLENVNDSAMVWRLVTYEGLNNTSNELSNNDSLHLGLKIPFRSFHYSLEYFLFNPDSVLLIVRQAEYEGKSGRVIFLPEWANEKFQVSDRCPNSIIYKEGWFRRRILWRFRM